MTKRNSLISFNKSKRKAYHYSRTELRKFDLSLTFILTLTVGQIIRESLGDISRLQSIDFSLPLEKITIITLIGAIGGSLLAIWGIFVGMWFWRKNNRAATNIPYYLVACAIFGVVISSLLIVLDHDSPELGLMINPVMGVVLAMIVWRWFEDKNWVKAVFHD